MMQSILIKLKEMLEVENNTLNIMNTELADNDELCDDTEYMNNYHNLEGFISGLEAAISVVDSRMHESGE